MAARATRKLRDSAGPTREMMLSTALEIIDQDGVGGLTMRRLGDELGCDPMSLYRHAASKSVLLDYVAESVLLELTVDVTDPDWAGQLRGLARQFRGVALAHPKVVPLLVTRPLSVPMALWPLGALRPLEAVLELLVRAGFSEVDALRVYRLVYGSMQGHVLNELQVLVANHEETDPLLRLGLQGLSLRDFPRLRHLAPVLAAYDGAEELENRMDIMLTGLQIELHPTLGDRGENRT
ncbi:TetR/AcrR family transcriptional regulator [Demequina aurantiaca]|uniref:TetR/AcrR family transcriptional regulator n=1 Tax=Demequina aurantiaca TaxID=676200 RepID=UPI003D354589